MLFVENFFLLQKWQHPGSLKQIKGHIFAGIEYQSDLSDVSLIHIFLLTLYQAFKRLYERLLDTGP